jgi:hypothetical protein
MGAGTQREITSIDCGSVFSMPRAISGSMSLREIIRIGAFASALSHLATLRVTLQSV